LTTGTLDEWGIRVQLAAVVPAMFLNYAFVAVLSRI
jgi:hypothetical protein